MEKMSKNRVKAKNQLVDFIGFQKVIFAKNDSKPKLAKVLNKPCTLMLNFVQGTQPHEDCLSVV
jgi:hypothetical protein